MPWNNLKTHCHTANFDTKKEKIVLISETIRNLEIDQLYLDKGLKQIANKYAGRNIDRARKEKSEYRKFLLIFGGWNHVASYNVQEVFC